MSSPVAASSSVKTLFPPSGLRRRELTRKIETLSPMKTQNPNYKSNIMNLSARILMPLACIAAFSATAGGAVIYNASPNFQRTGFAFDAYNIFPSQNLHPGGLYLTQQGSMSEMDYGDFIMPAQPAYSLLSSSSGHSNSFFVMANLGDTITSTSPNLRQLLLVNGNEYYIGFKVTSVDDASAVYKGWFQVTVSGVGNFDDNISFTLNKYAYDNTGASIIAGSTVAIPEVSTSAVPEASTSLGLLALGAGGILTRRRSKRAA
jgi:hypothetical protein